ncbi:MAG TPA: hypothetical protein VJA26_09280 [Gammaproteobacteria bacterium]|nr:hypothetical protein [Gammaproteobacteria bacterium]
MGKAKRWELDDVEEHMLAFRICGLFEAAEQHWAEVLAVGLARILGPEVRHLMPETPLSEILEWSEYLTDPAQISLQLEAELGFAVDLSGAAGAKAVVFRDIVKRVAAERRGVRLN